MSLSVVKFLIGFILLEICFITPRYLPHSIWWMVALLFFPISHWVAKWTNLGGLQALGLTWSNQWFRNVIWGLMVGFLLFVIDFIIPVVEGTDRVTSVSSVGTVISVFVLQLLGTTIVAFSEEILMRGFVFNVLRKTMSVNKAVVVSSLIFTAGHFYFWGIPYTEWIRLFVFGVAMAIAYVLTKSLWLSMGLHWGWNFGNYLLGEGPGEPGALTVTNIRNDQWTGWMDIVITIVMILIIYLVHKHWLCADKIYASQETVST